MGCGSHSKPTIAVQNCNELNGLSTSLPASPLSPTDKTPALEVDLTTRTESGVEISVGARVQIAGEHLVQASEVYPFLELTNKVIHYA